MAAAPFGSQWWVKMKDEVSHEPDALVEVTGYRYSGRKPRVLVTYVDRKSPSGGELTGTFSLKKLLRRESKAQMDDDGTVQALIPELARRLIKEHGDFSRWPLVVHLLQSMVKTLTAFDKIGS